MKSTLAKLHMSFVKKNVSLFGAFKQYVKVCADNFLAVSKNNTLLSFLLLTYTDILLPPFLFFVPPFGGTDYYTRLKFNLKYKFSLRIACLHKILD